MDETAARRWDPLEGVGGFAVAGCAGVLRLLAGGVWVVPSLAAGRGVGRDHDRAAGAAARRARRGQPARLVTGERRLLLVCGRFGGTTLAQTRSTERPGQARVQPAPGG